MNMHVSREQAPDTEWLGDWGRRGPRSARQVARTLGAVVSEVTDDDVEVQKPGNRAWILDQLRMVLEVAAEASPDDPRFLKIRLDALDRMGKILRVTELQGAREREGDLDRVRLVAAAAKALEELETKVRTQ